MKKRKLSITLIALATIALFSFANTAQWIHTGSDAKNYDMGGNVVSVNKGIGVNIIKSKSNNLTGFGALMQQLPPGTFAGKRVKVSGVVRTTDVSQFGGLWMSVNQPYKSTAISLDNIKHTNYSGSLKGFTYCQIVMDVPQNSTGIAYGSLLKGSGEVAAGRVFFDIVEKNIPLTN